MPRLSNMPPDPVRLDQVNRVMASAHVDELLDEIVRAPVPELRHEGVRWRSHKVHSPWIVMAAVAVVIALAVVVPLAVVGGGGGLSHTTTTAYQAGRAFSPSPKAPPRTESGRWHLVSALFPLSGSWHQNTLGPPPGSLTCVSGNVCYVLAGKYASPSEYAPLLGESLYVSDDFGQLWTVLPLPKGFIPSTPLTCPEASACLAGGALNGHPILISTTSGGHQWTMTPLAGVSGELLYLVCSSTRACHGVVAPSQASTALGRLGLISHEELRDVFVSTSDGGADWATSPLPTDRSVGALACPDFEHCLVVGTEYTIKASVLGRGPSFAMITSDGGRTWGSGSIPAGFSLKGYGGLSCADDLHCDVLGTILAPVANPPQCVSTTSPPGKTGSPTTSLPLSPSVAAIADEEGRIAEQANNEQATSAPDASFSCSPNGQEDMSDIAVTTDGGHTWVPEDLPTNVPDPQLIGISCATANICWASGSEALPMKVGQGYNADSSMLLGSTDGGATWSKVTFNVPAGAPNPYGQEYLSMGDISCPSATGCVAVGVAAQSSATVPVYRFIRVPTS
jgi:hypothetical protein